LPRTHVATFDQNAAEHSIGRSIGLAEYDLARGTAVRLEFGAKDAQVNMRVPQPLLDAVKAQAKAQGIPYTRFIRKLMEQAISRPS
jgi:predicted DNA binding CopG/RHH family protein